MNAVSPQEERQVGADDSPATPKLCAACGSRYPVDALFCPTDGTPLQLAAHSSGPDVDPYLGKEILGHIEIRQLVGIGAMGRVYRAFQKGIDRFVAVKILHRELSANQQLVTRFHREAKVASRLSHANVVHAYLTGQLPDGSLYIVMEYLDGLSLQSALAAAGGAMPLARSLHIALQLCDAAGEAHAQGVVHRDIKPENVMLVRRGDDEDFVKVLDFGIARLNWGEQSMATAAGLIFGTARYISPEGAQGEQVGPQSDVYSIATLLYQMLSARTPFEGESAVSLLVQQIHDPPPPLRSIPRAAYVPEPIAAVVMKNLAKTSRDRAQDGRVLGRALVEAAKASGLSPEELLARGTLLGNRPSSAPMQIAPLQRTRQMMLDAQTVERMAGPSAAPNPPSKTPAAVGPASRVPLGAPTTKWVPPEGFEARIAAAAPGVFPVPAPARRRAASTPRSTTTTRRVPGSSCPRRRRGSRRRSPRPFPRRWRRRRRRRASASGAPSRPRRRRCPRRRPTASRRRAWTPRWAT
jgi:serine/threonine-protein kinase